LNGIINDAAKASKGRRKPKGTDSETKRRRFMAKEVPEALEKAGMFTPAFMQKVAVSYLETGNPPELSEGDLKNGVDWTEALDEWSRIQLVVSGRQNAFETLENARNIDMKKIELKVLRKDVACDKVPAKRVYRLDEDIPIYPCDDCDVQPACLAWYSYVWD
jgi:hypothetical protein